MTNEKVILPKDVADAIEVLKKAFNYEIYDLINVAHTVISYEGSDEEGYVMEVDEYSNANYESFLSALVNGYEVEKPPEEKVREYYRSLVDSARYDKPQLAITQVLNLLGIKIVGVND